jgi:broad specificity phosphatase PhoE
MKMRTWAIAGLALAILACWPLWWWFCGRPTTLLILRHADRDAGVDALNAAGVARAQELAHVAEKSGIVAIYRSNTNRARDTAAPLATALAMTPVVYSANDASALVAEIFADHRGEKVLVVGHSNTVPDIIQGAGGPSLPDIDDREFDNLFVLTVYSCGRGRTSLVNLQYGALSPP